MSHDRNHPAVAARTAALLLGVLTLWSFLFAPIAGQANTRERPNIILILADDLGWGDLGCYGQTHYRTPHIDRMAAEGARLTQFYVPAAYCAPTRAALLTGRYQFRSGMTGNPAPDGNPASDEIGLPASEITLGEAFQSAGYSTALIGKWHLGHKPQFYPRRHGFDEYFGILYSNDMRPVELIDGEKVVEYPVAQATLTKRYTERALGFVERNKSKPFFLYLAHAMPHKPLAVSEAFYKKSGAGLYGDVIAELDWSTGEVLRKVKELGLDEKTLIVFMSDNGPWFGGSTGGLRGMKGSTWEGGIRVPMIARWPKKIPAGHVSNEIAAIIDLFPTVLNQAGIPLPGDRVFDGKDIFPLLTSGAKTPHEALFSMAGARLHTVRDSRWKLHVAAPGARRPLKPDQPWVDPRGPDGVTILAPCEQAHPSQYPGLVPPESAEEMILFDLENDPGETHNVAGMHSEVVERLKKIFDQLNAQVPAATSKGKRL